ncbi:MAG: division/cell wall cluster transcriptional repressor MraZ [bacterium]
MLIGEYTHTLDDKKRVSLPSKFRKELGKQIVITPGLDNCLFIFTMSSWKEISNKLSSLSFLQSDNRGFNRFLFGQAGVVDIDASGRVLIPDTLREKAGISAKAVFVGVQDRVEIWDESAWLSYKQNIEKEADTLAEKLGAVGAL